MDRALVENIIKAELAEAQAFMVMGRAHVERQREIVREFQSGGHDTARGEDMLRRLEKAQAVHETGVKQLKDALATWKKVAAVDSESLIQQSYRELQRLRQARKLTSDVILDSVNAIKDSRYLLKLFKT